MAESGRWRIREAVDRRGKMQEQSQFEPLMNDAQAADFLGGLHPKTVQRMARRGELPHYRVGKYYRYRASELNEWLKVHSHGQNPSSSHSKGDAIQ
jgi:excisionase family DNA binding protein